MHIRFLSILGRTVCCPLHCDSVMYYIPGWAIKVILNAAPITEIEVSLQAMLTTPTPRLCKVIIHSCLFVVPLQSDSTYFYICWGLFDFKGIDCTFISGVQPEHFRRTPSNPLKNNHLSSSVFNQKDLLI